MLEIVVDHMFFIHSSVDGDLGCFHILAIVNNVIYIYRILLSPKKKDVTLPFVTTWMDLEGIMLTEIRWRKTNAM